MGIYAANGVQRKLATCDSGSGITLQKFVVPFTDPVFAPGGVAITNFVVGDLIQIGVVPAGEVLVPHLCLIKTPAFDSNTPVGTGTIGSSSSEAAVAPSFVFGTAQTLTAEDFSLGTAEIGADNADTPIYIAVTHILSTIVLTGSIEFIQVSRPWDSSVDGASTT